MAAVSVLMGSSKARQSISFLEIVEIFKGPQRSADDKAIELIQIFYADDLDYYLLRDASVINGPEGQTRELTPEEFEVARILQRYEPFNLKKNLMNPNKKVRNASMNLLGDLSLAKRREEEEERLRQVQELAADSQRVDGKVYCKKLNIV